MSLRYVVSALLLFAAAVGWLSTPLPSASDRDRALLALRQLRDDGQTVALLQPLDPVQRLRVRALPITCVLLGVGVLLAGLHHRHEREQS